MSAALEEAFVSRETNSPCPERTDEAILERTPSSDLRESRFRSSIRRFVTPIVHKVRQPIPVREEFVMSPFRKCFLYGRLPFKFFTTVAILVLLNIEIFSLDVDPRMSDSEQRETLIKNFMPEGYLGTTEYPVGAPTYYFYALQDITKHFEHTTKTYDSAVKGMSSELRYYADVDTHAAPPTMRTTFFVRSARMFAVSESSDTVDVVSYLTPENPYGPLTPHKRHNSTFPPSYAVGCHARKEIIGNEAVYFNPCRKSGFDNALFDNLRNAEISFDFTAQSVDSERTPTRYTWNVVLQYDFTHTALCVLTIHADCSKYSRIDGLRYDIIIVGLLCIFCVWDFVLRVRHLQRIRQYRRAMEGNGEVSSTESSEKDEEKHTRDRSVSHHQAHLWHADLRSGKGEVWAYWSMVSDAGLTLYCILALVHAFTLVESTGDRYIRRMVLGVAGLVAYSSLLAFFRYFPRIYLLIRVIATASPHLLSYLVGIVPIYVGYLLFGVATFGAHAKNFQTASNAWATLIAMNFGDSLLDIFERTGATSFSPTLFISRIYNFTYILLTMWVIMVMAVAVVGGAFGHVQERYGVASTQFDLLHFKSHQRQYADSLCEAEQTLLKMLSNASEVRSTSADSDESDVEDVHHGELPSSNGPPSSLKL